MTDMVIHKINILPALFYLPQMKQQKNINCYTEMLSNFNVCSGSLCHKLTTILG